MTDAGVRKHCQNEKEISTATSNRQRPTILLADDESAVLDGVQRLLEGEFHVVGTAQDGQSLLAAARKPGPDGIVADISMPILNGFQAARQLKAASPSMKIIFLTVHEDLSFVTEARGSGVDGYVIKRSAAQDLVPAIRAVLQGSLYVSPAIQQ